MTNQAIQLKIVLPHKVLPAKFVTRVVIPAVHGMMTIIPERAPITVLLKNGILDILDENDKSVKRYFIQGGVANVAANECVIMTQKALDMEEVNVEKISALKTAHEKELQELNIPSVSEKGNHPDSDELFYEEVREYLSIQK